MKETELIIPNRFKELRPLKSGIRVFLDCTSKLKFVLVESYKGGIGCSDRTWDEIGYYSSSRNVELNLLRNDLSPFRQINLPRFLIAQAPISESIFCNNANGLVAFRPLEAFTNLLNEFELSLANEDEIELAFAPDFKNGILPFKEFEKDASSWMSFDTELGCVTKSGLKCPFVGEFTTEKLSESSNDRLCKFGAANFWPWQSEEWIWCLQNFRFSSFELPEFAAACRPIYRL